MSKLAYPWNEYAALQDALAKSHRVDDQAWGLEGGLNSLLAAPCPNEGSSRVAVENGSRKARNRARLLRVRGRDDTPAAQPEVALDAFRQLRAVPNCVSQDDWALLSAVAEGRSYEEVAAVRGVSPASLRVRVVRSRRVAARSIRREAA